MSSTTMTSSSSRVSIPNSVKKTIANIKEIAEKHSEDDIYAMLKDCSMDPHDTVQRLLYLDTFHQVKSKRDKRNEVVKCRVGEDSRWRNGHHGRGVRGAPGKVFSQHNSSDAGGRRNNSILKENGVEGIKEKRSRKPPAPVLKDPSTVQPHHVQKELSTSINGPVKMPNGNRGWPNASVKHAPSASDTVLTASGGSLIPTAVGVIQQEVRIEQIYIETTAHVPVDNGFGKTESTSNGHLDQSNPQNVEGSPAYSSVVLKEISQSAYVGDSVSTVELQGAGSQPGAEEATSKLVKLKFSDGQHVIIPDHIQVPDAVKNMLSFGSIDESFGVRGNYLKNENNKSLHSAGDAAPHNATDNSSSCVKDTDHTVSTAVQVENTDNQQPQSKISDENHPVDTQVSLPATNDDQLEDRNLPAMGPPFPYAQTSPSYSFGFMPPMLANTLLQPEVLESQAHVSSSLNGGSPAACSPSFTPPLSQSSDVGQASIAVPPQPIPLTPQPFPPNYIPYSHYFPPFYVHPTMHQYYGHTAFPPPLPTSNVFLPPPPVAASMKTSPASYKPRANAGNQASNGIPSGYGVYSPNAAVTSGNPNTSVDLMPTASKGNYIYSGQQGEGSAVWLPATGRETASFPLNSFINFPSQGHHVISPLAGHGPFAVYHTLQPMPTSAPGHPLHQQSHSVTGQVNSVGPSSNGYPPQVNWNN